MNLDQIWQNIETARQKCGAWENVRLIAVSKNVGVNLT